MAVKRLPGQESEESLEKSQELADMIRPFIQAVDAALDDFDMDYAKQFLKRVNTKASTTMAIGPIFCPDGGLDAADSAREIADFYEALLKVFELRKKQQENTLKRAVNKGARMDMARRMGLV